MANELQLAVHNVVGLVIGQVELGDGFVSGSGETNLARPRERAEHDGAGDGADHGAGAAEQAGAADDHGGDCRQLVAHAVIGAAEIELAGMHDAG